MKFWKLTLITAFAFFSVAVTVLYSACVKDSCVDLRCKNGGSCADGYCHCQSGYEGAECEIIPSDKFVGTYYGYVDGDGFPKLRDTVDVFVKERPITVSFVRRGNKDTISGKANGYFLIIPDVNQNNTARYASLMLDSTKPDFPKIKKITLYTEYISNVATGAKITYSFSGTTVIP